MEKRPVIPATEAPEPAPPPPADTRDRKWWDIHPKLTATAFVGTVLVIVQAVLAAFDTLPSVPAWAISIVTLIGGLAGGYAKRGDRPV